MTIQSFTHQNSYSWMPIQKEKSDLAEGLQTEWNSVPDLNIWAISEILQDFVCISNHIFKKWDLNICISEEFTCIVKEFTYILQTHLCYPRVVLFNTYYRCSFALAVAFTEMHVI